MMINKLLLAISISSILFTTSYAENNCHPEISDTTNNYLIGYGSLMNDKSRAVTNPSVKNVYPILVKNYERVWGLQPPNLQGTFLLAVPKKGSEFNGVYYKVDSNDLVEVDKREITYCRVKLKDKNIEAMALKSLPNGIYWIYSSDKKDKIKLPSKNNPITQHYVDIFINGCLQMQNRYNIPKFSNMCITTTHGWSDTYWVNDRIYPRRPTDTTPNALLIDKKLSAHLKNYYKHPFK